MPRKGNRTPRAGENRVRPFPAFGRVHTQLHSTCGPVAWPLRVRSYCFATSDSYPA